VKGRLKNVYHTPIKCCQKSFSKPQQRIQSTRICCLMHQPDSIKDGFNSKAGKGIYMTIGKIPFHEHEKTIPKKETKLGPGAFNIGRAENDIAAWLDNLLQASEKHPRIF